MPPWLRTMLEAAGRLDTDGVHRKLTPGRCRDCGAEILTGLDGDRCAGVARVDPWPVDVVGECSAVLAGRASYDLWGLELCWRSASSVGKPGRQPVLVDHRCGAPIPAHDLPGFPYSRLASISDEPQF